MCIRVCVRIAYLQACKAIDSENKIKQQSPTHTRTHTQTLPFTHTCTHSSTHSLSCSTSPFLSLSRTPAQWRQLSWIIAAGSFLQFALWWWWCGAGTSTGDDVGVDTTSCSAALRTAEQRSAAMLVLAAALAALPFRISHSTSWRSERQRGSVHRLVRRSQLTFSARWNLVADGRVFVSTVPQFHHSASAASSQAAPQQTLVALRRRRSPISASRKCSLNNS